MLGQETTTAAKEKPRSQASPTEEARLIAVREIRRAAKGEGRRLP